MTIPIYTKGFFTFTEEMKDQATLLASNKSMLSMGRSNNNVLAFEPFRYPIAWQYYKDAMMQNNWTPSEIGMARDIAQFNGKELNQAQEHMFLTVLSMLTSMDLKTEKNVLYIAQNLECAEWMQVAIKHAEQEGVHTWAYKYCIDELGLDPLDIFYRFNHIPQIEAKVNFASVVTQTLADLFRNPNRKENDLQEFLHALCFWYLGFEWGWFGSGLAVVPSLNRIGLLPGVGEQFWYILRDEWTHVDYGAQMINTIKWEHPEAWTKGLVARIIGTLMEMIQLEDEAAAEFLRDGCITTNLAEYKLHVRHNFKTAASFVGIDLPVTGKPASYYDGIILHRKEKNFFETRVTEYRTGGVLSW